MEKLNVIDFGADRTGENISTAAIQDAVGRCPEGGCVYIPEGIYISGALFLKSNMTLYIEKGAVIRGSDNADDFPVNIYRWGGNETECYSSFRLPF